MRNHEGEWRESGSARELIAPSPEWLLTAANDPDAERRYVEAQARLASEQDALERLAVIEIQRKTISPNAITAQVEEMRRPAQPEISTAKEE